MCLIMKIKHHTIFMYLKIFENFADFFSNCENFHYVLIKDFDKLVTNKARHHGEKNLSVLLTLLL